MNDNFAFVSANVLDLIIKNSKVRGLLRTGLGPYSDSVVLHRLHLPGGAYWENIGGGRAGESRRGLWRPTTIYPFKVGG